MSVYQFIKIIQNIQKVPLPKSYIYLNTNLVIIQYMSVLYTLSNIFIPFSLLIFSTLKRSSQQLRPQYGKWTLLFLLTFIFNGLFIFRNSIITLIDLAVKISIYFLPESINNKIQELIQYLHLQGIIQTFRCKLINQLFKVHSKLTLLIIRRLRPEEGHEFKTALIQSLNGDQELNKLQLKANIKINENKVNNQHQILVTLNGEDTDIPVQQKRAQAQIIHEIQRKSESKNKYEAERQIIPQKQSTKIRVTQNKKDGYKTQSNIIKNTKRQEPQIQSIIKSKQNSRILQNNIEGLQERQKERPLVTVREPKVLTKSQENKKTVGHSPVVQKQQYTKKFTMNDEKIQKVQKKHTRKHSCSPESQSLREQAQILQRLDLTASEYSDLFEEQNRDQDLSDEGEQAKLVCKVEAIVQIGSAPSFRLQIYNIQLYSNGDLRIVSLYNREFERHRLISMTKGLNNYYELTFSGGSVNKRRVKFRGQHQPFMKYLVTV